MLMNAVAYNSKSFTGSFPLLKPLIVPLSKVEVDMLRLGELEQPV